MSKDDFLLTPEELDAVDEAIHKEGIYYKIKDEREAWLYHHRKFNEAQLAKAQLKRIVDWGDEDCPHVNQGVIKHTTKVLYRHSRQFIYGIGAIPAKGGRRMIRQWIKGMLGLYDIEELQAGGWCGCCGKWLENEVVPKDWPWTVCPDWETSHKEAK